jgi:hypothetical protein
MPYPTPASPDHPSHGSHGRNARLDGAFERLVTQDRLLGSLAGRHFLQRDLRLSFLAVLGPPLLWLLTGQVVAAAILAVGFGALFAVSLWTVATQPAADSRRLLSAIRWIAALLTVIGALVAWSSPTGATGNPAPGIDRPAGAVTTPPGSHRTTLPGSGDTSADPAP